MCAFKMIRVMNKGIMPTLDDMEKTYNDGKKKLAHIQCRQQDNLHLKP